MVRLGRNEPEKVVEFPGCVASEEFAGYRAGRQFLDQFGIAHGVVQQEVSIGFPQYDLDLAPSEIHAADVAHRPHHLVPRFARTRLKRREVRAPRVIRRLVVIVDVTVPASTVLVRNAAPAEVRQWPIRHDPKCFERVDLGRPDGAQVQPPIAEIELVAELLLEREPAELRPLAAENRFGIRPILVVRDADAGSVFEVELM